MSMSKAWSKKAIVCILFAAIICTLTACAEKKTENQKTAEKVITMILTAPDEEVKAALKTFEELAPSLSPQVEGSGVVSEPQSLDVFQKKYGIYMNEIENQDDIRQLVSGITLFFGDSGIKVTPGEVKTELKESSTDEYYTFTCDVKYGEDDELHTSTQKGTILFKEDMIQDIHFETDLLNEMMETYPDILEKMRTP